MLHRRGSLAVVQVATGEGLAVPSCNAVLRRGAGPGQIAGCDRQVSKPGAMRCRRSGSRRRRDPAEEPLDPIVFALATLMIGVLPVAQARNRRLATICGSAARKSKGPRRRRGPFSSSQTAGRTGRTVPAPIRRRGRDEPHRRSRSTPAAARTSSAAGAAARNRPGPAHNSRAAAAGAPSGRCRRQRSRRAPYRR